MGIDAESQDLTARIRAIREQGVRRGDIAPARPGEFRVGGVSAPAAAASGAAARASEARSRRSPGSQVVPFVYTDEELAQMEDVAAALSPEDGGDQIEATAPEQQEEYAPVPDSDLFPELDGRDEPPETVLLVPMEQEQRIIDLLEGIAAKQDALGEGLVMIARAVAELQERLAEPDTAPEPEPERRRFRLSLRG